MEEIVLFVSSALTGGVAYDAVKVSLGSHYEKLSSYLSKGEDAKFEGALEILLEDKDLREKIEAIMDGKIIEDSFKNLKGSKVDAELGKGAKVTDSFKDNTNSPIKIR